MTDLSREVIIEQSAGLYVLRCFKPCRYAAMFNQPACMDMDPHSARSSHPSMLVKPGCYLGGSMSAEGARQMAKRVGYTVRERGW